MTAEVPAEAIEAAILAVTYSNGEFIETLLDYDDAEAVIRAALPVLHAQWRESVAVRIEADRSARSKDGIYELGVRWGLSWAARIVRGDAG